MRGLGEARWGLGLFSSWPCTRVMGWQRPATSYDPPMLMGTEVDQFLHSAPPRLLLLGLQMPRSAFGRLFGMGSGSTAWPLGSIWLWPEVPRTGGQIFAGGRSAALRLQLTGAPWRRGFPRITLFTYSLSWALSTCCGLLEKMPASKVLAIHPQPSRFFACQLWQSSNSWSWLVEVFYGHGPLLQRCVFCQRCRIGRRNQTTL